MTAPDNLYQLVEKFERDQSQFQQPDYNEAQLRQEFVNPFFAALGWDVGDSKQVLHEAGLRSGGSVKHPDYSFLAGTRRAFYVETKKPAINIGNSVDPAEQLRSYGWSGNTALGILTNFAEFAVYDCRIEPKQGDSPAEARIMYLTHSQYLDQWERLQETLSPEAVRQGRHSDLLEATAKGVLRVDDAFLRDMESWRVDLAEHLHKQARFIDRTLNQRELNHLVQRTIDRIVFLRIAEDRNLESYGRLERAALSKGVYAQIKKLYLAADRRYNSGLFHFNPADTSRPEADTLSMEIYIVDNVLRRIINRLYPPESRYQFSVISADILGQVYERFLGKVIEVRSDGETTDVTVEEKPEVRKAGGVYYTPSYIVDYIVENTVGALLKDKSPDEAMKLRVLDPACGSGSFLTGAYQYLLDWHLTQYRENPQLWKNRIRHSTDGIILRIEEKRRILLDNIYGVDLDQNAVEVSKLSLLLKMLENEHDTLDIEEPLLPDLSGNIKWGNSLIGSDFFSGQDMADLDDEELLRVKPFDWASGAGFGEIMTAGGFDAVIGNPPYVRPHNIEPEHKEYFWRTYSSFVKKSDLYCCFIERSIKLLKEVGRFGMIVSNSWLRLDSFEEIRKRILSRTSIRVIIDFTNNVFDDAAVKTNILLCSKPYHEDTAIQTAVTTAPLDVGQLEFRSIRQSLFESTYKHIFDLSIEEESEEIKAKMRSVGHELGGLFSLSFGLKTGDDSKFLTYEIDGDNQDYKRLLRGENISRYSYEFVGEYVHYLPQQMKKHRRTARPGTKARFEQPKVLVRDTGEGLRGTFENEYHYVKDVLVAADKEKNPARLKYLTGLINSTLLRFYYETSFPTLHVQRNELASLPIRAIDFDNPADVAMHDKMVELVERMLDLHRQADLTVVQHGLVEQRIEATDREIDELVYALYGLGADEREIVEGG